MRGLGRILHLEDDLNTQASITEMLQGLGYELQFHSDLGSAIDHNNYFNMVIAGGMEILNNV